MNVVSNPDMILALSNMNMLVPREAIVLLIPTEINPRSHGHSCVLTLAHTLQERGFIVSLLPYQPFRFFRHYYRALHKDHQKLRFIVHPHEAPGGLLIASEGSPPALVKRLRRYFHTVLWWLLAPSGVLTEYSPGIRPDDLLIAFSSFALPHQSSYLFVQPREDQLILNEYRRYRPQRSRALQLAIYTGKGRLKPLPPDLHRRLLSYEIRLITRAYPATKAELIQLLIESHGLISFDPMTNLIMEAARLGLPVFLPGNPFRAECYEDFAVDLSSHVTDDSAVFLQRLDDSGPVRKLSLACLGDCNSRAADLIALLTSGLPSIEKYRVTPYQLAAIESFRRSLRSSRTIQATYDGQALSSALTHVYLATLKLPYKRHAFLCHFLHSIDGFADLLGKIGIFRILQPMIRSQGSRILSLGKQASRVIPQ